MPSSTIVDDQDRANSSNTYGFTSEIIVVEIDPETGKTTILKWFSMHDAGVILNPMLVEGQINGACTHGLAASLYEEVAYDENGQCLTASFQDFLVPTAMEVPRIEIGHIETPSPFTELGSKGTGEADSMAVPPALGNALADALAPLGVTVNKLPMSPNDIWHLIQEAQAPQEASETSSK